MVRPLGGWLADRIGGAKVTVWSFAVMALAAVGLLLSLPAGSGGDANSFFLVFMVLFFTAGVGNGSVFHLVPAVFRKFHEGRTVSQSEVARDTSISIGEIEASVALGFTASIGALAMFIIPAMVAVSIENTGSPRSALFFFIAFYLACLFVTWWWYRRQGAEVRCD
jgi:NNP family nitrate/nitrite transporter-like MFS transporter